MTNRQIARTIADAVLAAPKVPRRTLTDDPATDAVLDTLGRHGYAFCDAREWTR